MDFYQICKREIERGPNKGEIKLYPDFVIGRSKDLMVRGRSFYAIWDEAAQVWSTDEYDVQRLIDAELKAYADRDGVPYHIQYLRSSTTQSWLQFRKFIQNISDNSHQLDDSLTFANSDVKKEDYVSKRLPYALAPGDYSAWDEMVGTLYSVEERQKIEWIIGAIVSGDSKKIHKFGVFYGPPASGKSTILNIIEKLFQGYTTAFEAKALGSANATFAAEVFKGNPLVGIQQDGDLSRIDDNTRLNSIIAHEPMVINEKHKASFTAFVNAFLLMGTNQPVKITDAKSGIIRRLIDIHPTGVTIPTNHYFTLLARIDFELGAIASHCLEVYREMGKNYYEGYRPLDMMLQTDVFFNFIEAYYDVFKAQDSTTLKQAYALYKEFCAETGIARVLPQYKIREELRQYFDEFKDKHMEEGVQHRSWYQGFNANKFKKPVAKTNAFAVVVDETVSLFDQMAAEWPAQLSIEDENGTHIPARKWANVKTKLVDVDTSLLHFVQVPESHIVIDFDLKGDDGEKSLERNLEAASLWPATYAELSQGGGGVHLHYHYDGDVSELSALYSEGIEVKTLLGSASLRRRLTKCNSTPVATISSGLPVKEKKVLDQKTMTSEKGLRDLIARALTKDINPGTKSNVDFIKHILDEAYEGDMQYDVSDLKPKILAFANSSTNQSLVALKTVTQMKFASETAPVEATVHTGQDDCQCMDCVKREENRVVLFDLEVYPNLFVICWKFAGGSQVVRMRNPTPQEVEQLFLLKLVGFNNRRYDNHILYARFLGYNNEQLYKLSQKIINGEGGMFPEAYNLSYADIYDFSSKKQTLKKFGIELGMFHMEMDIPWDQPVPPELVKKVEDYCENDVYITEATWEARKQDFVARQILADLSGLSVNDTTQKHTAKIIFGDDRNSQESFIYTDLSKEFPGYEFNLGKSTYRGENPSEGGYVHGEPGMYSDVAVLDITSMHPSTIKYLDIFGKEYTKRFVELLDARVAIKRRDYAGAKRLLGGKLAPYLADEGDADALAYALKIVINIVYGLTSARFDNPFRDKRNKDNIVAKRGALFMIDLKHYVQEQGFTVAHIKTDSIKIPNATPEIIKAVTKFGEAYGYNFEHEATYDKFCLVNDAVYVAREGDKWYTVGAQFQHPYVYKSLFSGEEITFEDLCETKAVIQGAMYLDFEHDRPIALVEGMHFVGRTGQFVPVQEGQNGGVLYRVKDGKTYAVTGTKGYLWLEAEHVRKMGEVLGDGVTIDMSYFEKLEEDAIKQINKFGNYEEFVR